MIKITLLKGHPECIPKLSYIWCEVFGQKWRPEVTADRISENLNRNLNEDFLPLTFIALNGDEAVGMCSLVQNDNIQPDFIYKHLSIEALAKIGWLSSLMIDSTHQKKGIGRLLINTIKKKAKALGLEKLYLFAFDPTIAGYYNLQGFRTIGTDEFKGYPVTVMETKL